MSQFNHPDPVPLPYWRAALAEVSLSHPVVPAESRPITIGNPGGAWRVTAAEPDITAWTKAQFDASKASNGAKVVKTIPLVLIAARLSERVSHGVKQEAGDIHKGLSILCVPCLLDRSGGLWPDPDRQPWIPRDLLEPTVKTIAIGHLDSYDRFVSHLPRKATSLGDTLQIAAELFLAVTGARLPLLPIDSNIDEEAPPVFSLDGCELVSAWHGLAYEPPVIARHLIKLYDHIIEAKPSLPLLEKLRTTADRPARPPLPTPDAQQWHASIWGHITRAYPLSPSQREAMVELARLAAGQVLAVNGPPGTGKTTLLQSVVAQLWVDAALRESECPLIVVTSTNVKAVENVLNSFAKISAETGHERWHPYGGGFGLFLASDSRESPHPTCTGKNNPYAAFETAEAVAVARQYYLERAASFFDQAQDSVADIANLLRQLLQHYAHRLESIIASRYEIYRATHQSTADGAATTCQRLLAHYQALIEAEQAQVDAADAELETCQAATEAVERDYEATKNAVLDAEKSWNLYLTQSPLWLDLLCFLPPVRRHRNARDRCFLLSNPLTEDRQHRDDEVEQHFERSKAALATRKSSELLALAERRAAIEQRKLEVLKRRKAAERAWAKINRLLRRWQDALQDGYESLLDVSLDDLNDRLDVVLRAPMFAVADWYWSGRWLLEMQSRLQSGEADSKGRAKLEKKYRRYAKLSPCLVSNFHMAPAFFTAWQGEDMPFWNTIDLLIVDEAGQVSPEVGAPMFALARRALVVGDVFQIEPVWNNGEATDRANAVGCGLTSEAHDPRYAALAGQGYTPASGNLMRIANRSCSIQKYEDVRGLMLTEHRRCVPELIDYCNRLIYSGRLEPKRPRIEPAERILPAFGYLNVVGQDKTVGPSRQNHDEAKAIARWLVANRERIEAHYADSAGEATPLWKLVGVITPFASQASLIERLLRKQMPDLFRKNRELTVGTVHALQGAERAVVIFSPTYGTSFTGGAFFDQKPNMLNVAVSRAKDSFLVIGNLELFDAKKRNLPSGLLATYLFHGDGSAALA